MRKLFLITCLLQQFFYTAAQKNKANSNNFSVIAYYAGPTKLLDSFPIEHLTHIIFSFGHLKGNKLHLSSLEDSTTIKKMVLLKKRNPKMKVILSLGGWGGCYTCSPVFDTAFNRTAFAKSVKDYLDYFKADGIDLDWEYPAIAGVPGHPYMAKDKTNFTALIQSLRKALGNQSEISFAAGGFESFIDSSIEWKKVMPLIDKVNIMTYDLVHGYSTTSGHHTPLYSTKEQSLSCDNAIKKLAKKGVPKNKMVIGAAFYARFFKTTDTLNNGLYRPCKFDFAISHSSLNDTLAKGFTKYWDPIAQAPYAFNPQRKLLVSYDNERSINLKTLYARKQKLNGIMFWQLVDDKFEKGLLQAMYNASKE